MLCCCKADGLCRQYVRVLYDRSMMIVAADLSGVTKPWSYQAKIEHLVFATHNEIVTDTVSINNNNNTTICKAP